MLHIPALHPGLRGVFFQLEDLSSKQARVTMYVEPSIGIRMPSPFSVAELPSFRRPPLVETTLSIQFATLAAFRSVHAGLFWSDIRTSYPRASEQPPLSPAFETFGGPMVVPPIIQQIQLFLSPPAPRFWFEAENGEHLLQVQQDRLIHNWRKQDGSWEYPRYTEIRQRLIADVAHFQEFLVREQLGTLAPNQCEVSYNNIIDLPNGANPHQLLEKVTPQWLPLDESLGLGQFEGAAIQMRFILRDQNSAPAGRVYVNITPTFRQPDLRAALQLEVTARGKPETDTVQAAFTFLDIAHEAVVRTFVAVTTSKLHEMWERVDG